LPSFSIQTAVDVLTLGTYPKLPTCIKDRILPVEKINNEDREETLLNLNRIIQCRLALSEMPTQLKNFEIKKGYVKFCVKNEFEIKLTLISDDFRMPWRLLKVNFLVRDSQDPNRSLVHKFQTNIVHDILQCRLNENQRPLVDVYTSLRKDFAFTCQITLNFF
jgi:mediator of RNA polymerase II transcription subunit 14